MKKYLDDNDRKEMWENMKTWVATKLDSLLFSSGSGSGSGSGDSVVVMEEMTREEIVMVMDMVFKVEQV